jgi:16S rRNA (guanine527-N7)-methyltransferase
MPLSVSRETLARAGVDVSRETLDRLDCYSALLLRWNRTVNLVAQADEHDLWGRHIADSAQLAALISPHVTRAIDLGSGAGLPGLVLSLTTGIHFDLIEADSRKAEFLRQAARATGAPVHIHAVRVELARIDPAPLITARALAPLTKLLRLATPLLRDDGVALFPKGRTVENELTAARREWHMQVRRIPSRTAPEATILMLSEIDCAGAPKRGAG